MITKYPWFGPEKGIGWGWTPITWEGRAVMAVFFAVLLGAYLLFGRSPRMIYATIGALALLFTVIFLTGTAPG